MPKIIGVKFRDTGKVYYFDPGESVLHYHDHVIVDTTRGIDYGTVVISPTEVAEEKVPAELRKMVRPATDDDDSHMRELEEKEKEAYRICKEKIAEHNLEMKLIKAEYTFDNSKLLFYFTADGRVDFRELVRELAGIFRIRIELRQVGVRDETKLLGGFGTCGRPLCCHTWLSDFTPVSIKMAKDQNLSLNPSKISGCCGRLMCCLKNEADTYSYLHKGMPNRGDYVTTPEGDHGDVHSVDILRQSVKVIVELDHDEKELREYNVKDITFVPKSKKPKKPPKEQESAETEGKTAERPGKRVRMARGERAERLSRAAEGLTDGTRESVSENEKFPENRERSLGERRRKRRERLRNAGSAEQTERKERSESGERPERGERTERPERMGRQNRAERPEREERAARPERMGRQERTERAERPGKRNRTERPERAGQPERGEDRAKQTRPSAEGTERNRRRRRRRPAGAPAKDDSDGAQKG